MKANYHTHVVLCGHANGMTEDYVKKAIELGYKSIGMSDHGPIKPNMMSKEDFDYNWLSRQMTYEIYKDVYLPDVMAAKEKYKDKINVYAGVEIEYIKEYHDYFQSLRNELDYMNLAIHFFYHKGKVCNGFGGVDYTNVISYAEHAKLAMETGLYDMIVHPDVYMHGYRNENGLNIFDDKCAEAAKIIIEASIANNVYLEINCGGLYKVTASNEVVGEFGYPRRQFWEIASKYKDIKVVIGVDAHDPSQLNAKEINDAKEFAKKMNIKLDEYCYNIEKKMNR